MTDSSIPTIFLNCFKQLLAKCSQTKHQELSNQIKNSINSLNDLIQNQSFDSFQVHLNPISVALKEDSNQFQTIILKCFFSIFNESKPDNYPRSQLTNFIIALTGTVNFDNDETTLLVAQICHTAMHSISGNLYIHGSILRILFDNMFKAFSKTKNVDIQENIKSMIEDLICIIFDQYDTPPALPQSSNFLTFTHQVSKNFVRNALIIRHYLNDELSNGNFSLQIVDADIYITILFFCSAVENSEYGSYSMYLALCFLSFILSINSRFFKTSTFSSIIKKHFSSIIVFSFLHPDDKFLQPSINILLLLYKNYSTHFISQFNVIFLNGLNSLLKSPISKFYKRAITILSELFKETDFLPEIFLNLDCRYQYKNIFHLILEALCLNSYPNQKFSKLTNDSLKKLLEMLLSFVDQSLELNKKLDQEQINSLLSEMEAKMDNNGIYLDNSIKFVRGVELFKKSPDEGIKYFVSNDFIHDSPEDIASFLFHCDQLDKNNITTFLISKTDISKSCLKNFIMHYDLSSCQQFDQALRIFFRHISLPSTDESINYILNEFAGLYLQTFKKSRFTNKSNIVEFSKQLLKYQAHFPKENLSFDQFVDDTKEIANQENINENFLKSIYYSIEHAPIILDPLPILIDKGNNDSNKNNILNWCLLKFHHELALAKLSQSKYYQKNDQKYKIEQEFIHFKNTEVIKPLFESICEILNRAILINIEHENENANFYLNNLLLSLKIAARCSSFQSLKILIFTLTSLIGLQKSLTNNFKMSQKNIDCFHIFLTFVKTEADFITNFWPIIIEQINLFHKLTKSNQTYFQSQDISQSLNDSIDKIFSKSYKYSITTVMSIINSIFHVSDNEIQESLSKSKLQNNNPHENKLFILEKLIILCVANMKRINTEWISIWDAVGDYLGKISASNNLQLSVTGTKYMCYLASKFLLRDESPTESYQSQFLLSFLNAFQDQALDRSRIYFLEMFDNLIKETAPNLKSGWIMVFQILTISTAEASTQNIAFKILTQLTSNKILTQSSKYASYLLSFIATFTKNTNSFAAIPFFDKIGKSIKDKSTWISLFENIKRCSQGTKNEIKMAAQESYLLNLTELAERILKSMDNPIYSKLDEKEIWENILVKIFDDFSFTKLDEFLEKLNDNFIQKYVIQQNILGHNFIYLVQLLIKSIFNGSDLVISKSMSILLAIINNNIPKTSQAEIISLLSDTVDKIPQLSIDNTREYISILHNFSNMFDARADFINIFSSLSLLPINYQKNPKNYVSTNVKEKENTQNIQVAKSQAYDTLKRNVICALACEALLSEIYNFSDFEPSKKIESIKQVFQIYLQSGFTQNIENEAGSEWTRVICFALDFVLNIDDETLSSYYQKLSEQLLSLMESSSKNIRSHLGKTIQKILILSNKEN